jgi:flagellar basal-body rod modification protein FlgD
MAAMAGLISQGLTAGRSLTAGQTLSGKETNPLTANPSSASSTSGAGSSSATISANDFLTLLVTEMQNQDPTADTDPNEYINQLVQVNSLEQLIDINQNLSTALGTSGSSSSGSSGQARAGQAGPGLSESPQPGLSPTGAGTAGGPGVTAGPHKRGAGNTAQTDRSSGTTANRPGSNVTAAINQFAQSAGRKGVPGNLSIPAAQPAAQRVARALDGRGRPAAGTAKTTGKQPVSK